MKNFDVEFYSSWAGYDLYPLVESHLKKGRTKERWDWGFNGNPLASSNDVTTVALDTSDDSVDLGIIGQYTVCPIPLKGGKQCVVSVDTIVHPDYRRQGVFRAMSETLYEKIGDKYEFAVGFVGEHRNSKPGFLKIGFQDMGQLYWYRPPEGQEGPRLRMVLRPPPRYEIDHESIDWFAWRFMKRPEVNYKTYWSSRFASIYRFNNEGKGPLWTWIYSNVTNTSYLSSQPDSCQYLASEHDPIAIAMEEAGFEKVPSGYTFILKRLASEDPGLFDRTRWYPQAGWFDVF